MKVEIGTAFPSRIEKEGTVMDFIEGEFIFVIKDEEWTSYEIQALKKRSLQVDFVYKFDIAIFLLTLDDAIDTSDFIFNVHDNDYDVTLFQNVECFNATLYLIDAQNIVQGKRSFTCSKQMTKTISDKLCEQRDHPYFEAEFTCNLEGLQSAYEPFELQEICLFSETYS